ncbi:hypothetical protein [Streptomyces virginiae]|uniref:hypothetical protein n=1 Tax=Streptomyces virginiae TaxID=1961 RepID=UPI0036F88B17
MTRHTERGCGRRAGHRGQGYANHERRSTCSNNGSFLLAPACLEPAPASYEHSKHAACRSARVLHSSIPPT